MQYNQILSNLTIGSGPDPIGPSPFQIRSIIEQALVSDNYTVNWINRKHQPYQLTVDNGTGQIDLYIYAWRISNGGRPNLLDEKRIQIQKGIDATGFKRPISNTEKTLLLGIYESPVGPVFAAWDATYNKNWGASQKSCQVKVQELLNGIRNGINECKDSHNNIIYTFTPSYLGDYIDLLQKGNSLQATAVVGGANGTITSGSIKKATLPNRKKRVLRSTNSLLSSVAKISTTEKESIIKQRIGQGLFKDLLKNKYGCKCALCQITTESMLVASHIKKWSDCVSDSERLDVNNGLLLCPLHDALFDKHLITFDEGTGTLIVSTTLSSSEKAALSIANIPNIQITPEMKPYLAEHHAKLKK